MPRSLGAALPPSLIALLDGTQLRERIGTTFLLVTVDGAGWPHVAMLSVGEVLARSERSLVAALWLGSTSTRNLEHSRQALLALVCDGAGYYVRLGAERLADLDLDELGRLAAFRLTVDDVQEDAVAYATLISGITFALPDAEPVVARWQRTIAALRSL